MDIEYTVMKQNRLTIFLTIENAKKKLKYVYTNIVKCKRDRAGY